MNAIILLIFGLVMGLSANLLHPTKSLKDMLATTSIGIAGALSGGIVALAVFGIGFVRYDFSAFSYALLFVLGLFFLINTKKAI